MKIYTRTGDDGTTGLFSGKRVRKDSTYIEAYGTVDELNAWLGHCGAASTFKDLNEQLIQIQHDLHTICADLATPSDAKVNIKRLPKEKCDQLEHWIDAGEKELAPLTQFILAGGTELASRLHIARTVCRRAERLAVTHAETEKVNDETIIYLNRLSDLLFVLARVANVRLQVADIAWDKSR